MVRAAFDRGHDARSWGEGLGDARQALAPKLQPCHFGRSSGLDAVAVMPFYGQGQGQGPSDVGLRGIYLNATLDSVRAAGANRCRCCA